MLFVVTGMEKIATDTYSFSLADTHNLSDRQMEVVSG